jgi:fumarate hydratase class I
MRTKGRPSTSKRKTVSSIHEALQFVSYYHPRDFIQHLSAAFAREESEAAKNAIAQILVSSRMAAIGRRP